MSERVMCRCRACGRQQTVEARDMLRGDARCGGCGGELDPFDWEAHRATLPYQPFKPEPAKPEPAK